MDWKTRWLMTCGLLITLELLNWYLLWWGSSIFLRPAVRCTWKSRLLWLRYQLSLPSNRPTCQIKQTPLSRLHSLMSCRRNRRLNISIAVQRMTRRYFSMCFSSSSTLIASPCFKENVNAFRQPDELFQLISYSFCMSTAAATPAAHIHTYNTSAKTSGRSLIRKEISIKPQHYKASGAFGSSLCRATGAMTEWWSSRPQCYSINGLMRELTTGSRSHI